MKKNNISKKILNWYDNNKRELPWRKHYSKKQLQYFTLVSEFMLQQTQVKTVIPYFNNFIKKIPNLEKLSVVNNFKLMKCWEGLGYYSRAKNLKSAAKKIVSEFSSNLPNTIEELKTLPGVGEYTSRAIMAIVFNKPIIPLDGNVERVLKRIFYLRNEREISKSNINNKKIFFGNSPRSSDYAQAIMEIGALICKPNNPLCLECPISVNCKSFKKKDFKLKSKNKFNKIKYFEAKIYQNKKKYLLIKNSKFKFLRNFLIFPMKEVEKNKFNNSIKKKINIKLSNMDMKILLNKKNKLIRIKNSYLLDKKKIQNQILPSFTKKIFNSVSNYT